MRFKARLAVISLVLCLIFGVELQAQNTGSLRGKVTDPSGAVVRQAKVAVTGGDAKEYTTVTNSNGEYEVKQLALGKYSVIVTAKGFSPYVSEPVTLASAAPQVLDVQLVIAVQAQTVEVEADAATVGTDAESNATAMVIKGKDLDALSDDPDDLASDLQALAGPSAGPNGGQIYIDGFSGGTLPPKSAIREIRINQNPFSAQYDRLGFGRVEVFTKPGQDQFHGQLQTNINHSALNSKNPFVRRDTSFPDYHSLRYSGNLSGPINKKSSFYLNFERGSMDEVSILTPKLPCSDYLATGACSSFTWDVYRAVIPAPRNSYSLSPRIDYQLTKNNTLTARYEYESSESENGGLGQYSLPMQATNRKSYEHSFRIGDTQIINASTINETRLQYRREHSESNALTPGMTIQVAEMFTGGGSSTGNTWSDQSNWEIQNYTSKAHGKHFIRFGGRVRVGTDDEYSLRNMYGTITYRNAELFQQGIWDQYTITSGSAYANVSQTDAGLYAEDDWKIRPNVTLSYGLRFETQSNVSNKVNLAPRIGLAWGLGKGPSPKTVLRTGFGMFYDRFSQNNVMQVLRTNQADPQVNLKATNTAGSTTLPDLTSDPREVYQINPSFKIPYTMQVAATLERQLAKAATLTVSYVGTRGLHQLLQESLGENTAAKVVTYRYDTAGTFKQSQLMVNSNLRMGKALSLFGYYVLGYSNSNSSGGFPYTPFNLDADWARSSFDIRHRGMIAGNISLPYGIRFNPFITMNSGRPYTITTSTDVNEDGRRGNDLPWYSSGCAGIPLGSALNGLYNTGLGCFSTVLNSAANLGRVLPNSLTGPGMFSTNLRVSKTFALGKRREIQTASAQGETGRGSGGPGGLGGLGGGPRGGGGGRGHGGGGGMMMGGGPGGMMGGGAAGGRYSLTFSASARNLFNTVNLGNPVGNLDSGYFGQSNSLSGGSFGGSANRRIDFSLSFSF